MGIFKEKAAQMEAEARKHFADARAAIDRAEKALTGDVDAVEEKIKDDAAEVIPNPGGEASGG
jgi:hypothetical protein